MNKIQLSPTHKGMKVSLRGCLNSNSRFAKGELENHINLMGKEYYKGNTAIVDQFLQLYCVCEDERKEVAKAQLEAQP